VVVLEEHCGRRGVIKGVVGCGVEERGLVRREMTSPDIVLHVGHLPWKQQ